MHNQLGLINSAEPDIVEASELGKCSLNFGLEGMKGKKIIFSGERRMVPVDGWGSRSTAIAPVVTTIQPVSDESLVAAVDSSATRVADTEDGVLYAVKCGVALAYAGKPFMHFKIGPTLFYLSESVVFRSILNRRLANLVLLDSDLAKRLIRIRTERSIQINLARRTAKGIILVDGSLKSSYFEAEHETILDLIESCALNRNSLVGLSKGTRLKVLERLAGPLNNVPYPSYLDVNIVLKSLIGGLSGVSMLVKLSGTGHVLRADLVEMREQTIGRLIGNDCITRGYPETLRLAHHISTFSTAELTGIRTHVVANYDVTELAADDLRASLLGSMPV